MATILSKTIKNKELVSYQEPKKNGLRDLKSLILSKTKREYNRGQQWKNLLFSLKKPKPIILQKQIEDKKRLSHIKS